MKLLAIDPGLSGAYAEMQDGKLLLADDLPLIGEGAQRRIDGAAFARIVSLLEADAAIIEEVNAMPKQGVSSTFRFGRAVGSLEGIVMGLGLRLHRVTPQRWKRELGLLGKAAGSGEPSRQRAIEMFPQEGRFFTRKKDHNRAEAALIGMWFHNSSRTATERVAA